MAPASPTRGSFPQCALPELIPRIDGAPRDVVEAAAKLACTEVVIVNLVIDRADLLDAHWTYIYDQDIFFTRLSTPHLQSPHNVPPGCGSIQAECYYSRKYRPLDRTPDECIEPTIQDLKKIGVLREGDKILYQDTMHIDYANVIFDLERADALKIVHGYLDDIGHRVLRAVRRLGVHLDRRVVHERREGSGKGARGLSPAPGVNSQ